MTSYLKWVLRFLFRHIHFPCSFPPGLLWMLISHCVFILHIQLMTLIPYKKWMLSDENFQRSHRNTDSPICIGAVYFPALTMVGLSVVLSQTNPFTSSKLMLSHLFKKITPVIKLLYKFLYKSHLIRFWSVHSYAKYYSPFKTLAFISYFLPVAFLFLCYFLQQNVQSCFYSLSPFLFSLKFNTPLKHPL